MLRLSLLLSLALLITVPVLDRPSRDQSDQLLDLPTRDQADQSCNPNVRRCG